MISLIIVFLLVYLILILFLAGVSYHSKKKRLELKIRLRNLRGGIRKRRILVGNKILTLEKLDKDLDKIILNLSNDNLNLIFKMLEERKKTPENYSRRGKIRNNTTHPWLKSQNQ